MPLWQRAAEWVLGLGAATALLAATVGYFRPVWLPFLRPDDLTTLVSLAAVLGPILGLVRTRRTGAERRAWTILSAGFLSYAIGSFVYLASFGAVQLTADSLWLHLVQWIIAPCAYLGIWGLLGLHLKGLSPAMVINGLIGGLGVTAVSSTLFIGGFLPQVHFTVPEVFAAMYLISDFVLVTLTVAGLSIFGWRIPRSWMVASAGLTAFVVANYLMFIQVTRGVYEPDFKLRLLWTTGALIVAIGTGIRNSADMKKRSIDRTMSVVFIVLNVSVMYYAGQTKVGPIATNVAAAAIVLALIRLILAQREVEAAAHDRALARIDDLTGLPNRRAFTELLRDQIADPNEQADTAARHALLLIDLDHFKEVNDTLGHATGDELLRIVGRRMRDQLDACDTLARWGGDEFAVLLHGADQARAVAVAERIVHALQTPLPLSGLALHVGGSIGITLYPEHSSDAGQLLRQADIAMYEAKSARQGWRLYQYERDEHTRARLEMLEQLRYALTHDEQLVLHYQPKATLDTAEVVGVEALVRWQHPSQGLLYPDAFLPLVESSGLMRELTLCVLRQAISQCNDWLGEGLYLPVAVNLSASSVMDDDLPEVLANFLREYGLPAQMLEVEITEDFLLNDRVRAQSVLSRIRELGIKVSVDDYGTGYSSLAYLRDLPVDQLKLDRSFVFPMADDPGAAAIVRSTVALAHSLGLVMVAEGVEDEGAWTELTRYGCDLAQGYFLSKPVTPESLVAWMREREAVNGWAGCASGELPLPLPRQTADQPTQAG